MTTQAERISIPFIKRLFLVHIELASGTLYFSTKTFKYVYGASTQLYQPFIDKVVSFKDSVGYANQPSLNSTVNLQVLNKKYSDSGDCLLAYLESNPIEHREIKIYELRLNSWGETFSSDCKILRFHGIVDQPSDITESGFALVCSSLIHGFNNVLPFSKLTKDVYASIDPNDLGKQANIIYGDLKKVPCSAVDAGVVSPLSANMTSSQTSIVLSDASSFPSSGKVGIEEEFITYTGKSSNTLTGCTRGADGTDAAIHDKGMIVWEEKTQFVYLVAKHPVKSIGEVYVDDIRITSAVTKYTGQSGNELSGYAGKAVIKADSKQVFKIRVGLEVDDTIDVSDTIGISDLIDVLDGIGINDGIAISDLIDIIDGIGVNDGITVGDNIDVTDGITVGDNIDVTDGITVGDNIDVNDTITVNDGIGVTDDIGMQSHSVPNMRTKFPDGAAQSSWIDGNPTTCATVGYTGTNGYITFSGSSLVETTYVWIYLKKNGSTHTVRITLAGAGYVDITAAETPDSGWVRVAFSTNVSEGASVYITGYTGSPTQQLCDCYKEVEETLSLSHTKTGSASKTGSVTKGGTVTKTGSASKSGTVTKTGSASKSGTVTKTGSASKSGTVTKTGSASKSGTVTRSGSVTKTGSASKTGTVTKTGLASKTGTVTLSGNSSADIKIGSNFVADVQGYQDDASGTITGTPNALIQRPDHIIEHIWTELLNRNSSEIGSSFATSGSTYASNSWNFAFNLPDIDQNLQKVFDSLAMQCKSRLYFVGGKLELVYQENSPPGGSDSITFAKRDRLGSPVFSKSSIEQVQNRLIGFYSRNFSSSSGYNESVKVNDATSQSKYGVLEESINLSAIQTSAHATSILNWLLAERKDVLWCLTMSAPSPALLLGFQDYFNLSETKVKDALDFRIMEISYDGSSIMLAGREW